MRCYADRTGLLWSAKYGLVHRDKVLAPYELISSGVDRSHTPINGRTTHTERKEGLDGSSPTQIAQESG